MDHQLVVLEISHTNPHILRNKTKIAYLLKIKLKLFKDLNLLRLMLVVNKKIIIKTI